MKQLDLTDEEYEVLNQLVGLEIFFTGKSPRRESLQSIYLKMRVLG